jgi:hypothetical protein
LLLPAVVPTLFPETVKVVPLKLTFDCPVTLLDVPLAVTKFPDVVEPPIDTPGPVYPV